MRLRLRLWDDPIALQRGREAVDLRAPISGFLGRERTPALALDNLTGTRLIRGGGSGKIEAMQDLAAAPIDGEAVGKALILHPIQRIEHPAQRGPVRLHARHSPVAAAVLLRHEALEDAKRAQLRIDRQCPRIGHKIVVAKAG